MIPETEKFLFNRSFDTPRVEKKNIEPELEETFVPEVPAPAFTQNDLDLARNEGFEKGKHEGLSEKKESLESQLFITVEKTLKELDSIKKKLDIEINNNLESSIRTSTTILKKIFPSLVSKHGTSEIESTLKKILGDLKSEPSVTIKINPELKSIFDNKIKKLAETANINPKIEIHGDVNILSGDCLVTWDSGTAERNSTEMWHQIDNIIEAHFPITNFDKGVNPEPISVPIPENILTSEENKVQEPELNTDKLQSKVAPSTAAAEKSNKIEKKQIENETNQKTEIIETTLSTKSEQNNVFSEHKIPSFPTENQTQGA